MGSCIEKQQIQFFVILLPHHQPIRFDVTFPLATILSAKDVGMIFCRKGSGFCKDADSFLNMGQVQTPLLTEFQVFLESVGEIDAVHTMSELD